MWQNISLQELFSILLATLLMLGAIMIAALLLIAVFKLLSSSLQKLRHSDDADDQPP